MMTWNAQIISHTHWDREWYLNSKYTNEWLVPFFDELFKMFDKERDYQFVLDGQMSMIDDYYEELKKLGKPVYIYRSKIKKYVQEGRLFIGPYYLQPDWQLLSEEALVRNLLIGHKKASEYGKRMDMGWLLDNFGQISQTSQIHEQSDIKGLYVWRGVGMDPIHVHSEFIWESPNGTQLPSVYLLNSYRNVMRLAEYSDIMKERIYDEVDKLKDFATTNNILMMNGYDQEMIPDDIQPFIKNGRLDTEYIHVTQSNPEKYLESVLAREPDLITLKGALYCGRFISVFPGVLSSRMYLKLQNHKSEKAIEKYAEPLSWINFHLGGDYDTSLIEKAWEILLKNHPHDSICGVSIDDVHNDMEERTQSFHHLIDHQVRKGIIQLGQRIDTSDLNDTNYFVFNPSPYKRSEVISIGGEHYYIDTIVPFGYSHITKNHIKGKVTCLDNVITNNKIEITINEDGTFNLYHKETKATYENLGLLEDAGDAGDEYNYSYPDEDRYYYSKDMDVKISYLTLCDEKVEVEVRYDMQIPIGITEDRKERSLELTKMPVRTVYSVEANSEVVKVKTEIKNTVKDHIVRVLFPTDIQTAYAYAGSPFDVVKRPIHIENYNESMIPENVRRVIVGAREAKPNTIFLGRELVDLNDGKKGIAVLSKGLPEYTVYSDKNTIALTLFRSIGWLAKDINTRIGDAGPEIFTPGAQCLREMTFEYAVYPHKNHYDEGNVIKEADRFNSDCITFVTDQHTGELPHDYSFMEVSDTNNSVRVTCIKRAEDGKGLIVRMHNSSEKNTTVTLKLPYKICSIIRVNFLEEEKETMKAEDYVCTFKVDGKMIETLYIDLNGSFIHCNTKAYVDVVKEEEPYDFCNYLSEPLVTVKDVESEEERAEILKDGLDNPLYRRTALEAQLSAILTRDRFHEIRVHELGYLLNEARVKRRVHDYINDMIK